MTFRRLIKDVATGLYYTEQGGWTAKESEATNYRSSFDAVEAGRKLGMGTLYLVLKFEDARMDVSHPIGKGGAAPTPRSMTNEAPRVVLALFPSAAMAAKFAAKMLG